MVDGPNTCGRKVLVRSLSQISFVATTWQFILNLISEFVDKKCQRSAAALTYMTLFALVPMMTVTYTMFSLFPVFEGLGDRLQGLIFQNFVPETGTEIQQYLSDFAGQARSLTGPGVAMLIVTAYLMLTNIEKTFNAIWGVDDARRGLTSFLLYWAVLSIGPLLLGAGIIMSTYLVSLKLVVGDVNIMAVASPVYRIVPILMGSVAFTLLFAAVPNCRVPIKDALTGGVVTAVCFELAKAGFAWFIANSSFQVVYGAFAAVPIFLIWINFLWMIILLGAVFVRTLAEKEYAGGAVRHPDLVAILLCLDIFRQKSQTGDVVSDRDCVKAGVGLVHWQRLRSLLSKHKWIVVTDSGHYVLARDLNRATLWEVAELVNFPATQEIQLPPKSAHWHEVLKSRQDGVNSNAKEALGLSLEELFSVKTE